MVNSFKYPALFESNGNNGFIVSFRDVKEALTEGSSLKDAKEKAIDALITSIEFYMDANKPFPLPSEPKNNEVLICLPISIVTKILLLNAMAEKHIRAIDLAKKMGIRPQEVNRILNLKHNTKIDTIERAFNSLNLNLTISISK
ncbi:type II toxin-antitoxin system HicB family antitoxin [Succinatimonas hippei]|uniref:type II toxin-antitoxin system HicB family antitoxin n=1 Tax=Succinatimonas hippei TaxID=626938 RepID=UPI00255C3E63|nr:type II toxin-antitoxin system HicB family antitoxin [Succinatimonas hippei]